MQGSNGESAPLSRRAMSYGKLIPDDCYVTAACSCNTKDGLGQESKRASAKPGISEDIHKFGYGRYASLIK